MATTFVPILIREPDADALADVRKGDARSPITPPIAIFETTVAEPLRVVPIPKLKRNGKIAVRMLCQIDLYPGRIFRPRRTHA